MSARNRVVWKEGLFIKPQHFQQQQRNIEYLLNQRVSSVSEYLYGITELTINTEYLTFGRVALDSASGVMPDGTVFSIPKEDLLPETLEIEDSSLANQLVYLAIPLRSDSMLEISQTKGKDSGRYFANYYEVRDIHTPQGDMTNIEVSPVRLHLLLEKDDRSAYASIAIARILEKRPDGSVVLDSTFIPCHLDVSAVDFLYRFLLEMSGLMRERAKNIATRIGEPGQGEVADVSDFMLLQALNRMQSDLFHLGHLRRLHPERLYQTLLAMCSELASFTSESRQAPELANYDHDKPSGPFNRLIAELRHALSIVLQPKALSIALMKRKYGLMLATLNDRSLINDADFILAVRARMPLDELRRLFVQQTKVSSVEGIRELISLQLPGIPLVSLPVAPRQLPYHAGYTYYQLDKTSPDWKKLQTASGFAFHVAGEFPDLELQFWAIRS